MPYLSLCSYHGNSRHVMQPLMWRLDCSGIQTLALFRLNRCRLAKIPLLMMMMVSWWLLIRRQLNDLVTTHDLKRCLFLLLFLLEDDESVEGRGTWFLPNYSYGFQSEEKHSSPTNMNSDQYSLDGFEVYEEEDDKYENLTSYAEDEEDRTTNTDDTSSQEKNVELKAGVEIELKDIAPESGYHLIELETDEAAHQHGMQLT